METDIAGNDIFILGIYSLYIAKIKIPNPTGCKSRKRAWRSTWSSRSTLAKVQIPSTLSDHDMLVMVRKINAGKLPPRSIKCKKVFKLWPYSFQWEFEEMFVGWCVQWKGYKLRLVEMEGSYFYQSVKNMLLFAIKCWGELNVHCQHLQQKSLWTNVILF